MAASRRTQAFAAALTVILTGTSSLQNAVANGDTRTLYIENAHTGESGSFTFKKDGRYDQEVLKKLNWIARDWRKNEPTDMDPELFDLIWEVYREVDAKNGIQLLCGYRSPGTNAMLRARSKGVAEQSQHTRGKAMDFFIPGVNLAELRATGLRMQRGGVGFYPSSNFVHMDTGSVRMWPRMTHDQLVKVFPDEKTVHVPADGKPLARYKEALAELENSSRTVAVASNDAGEGIRKFFASLFSAKKSVDEEEDEAAPATTKVASRGKAAPKSDEVPDEAPASASVKVAAAPLPTARPAEIAAAIITAQAVVAPLPAAPLPLRRPGFADTMVTASAVPTPPPLPAVITRGARGDSPEALLSYAPSTGDMDANRSLSHNLIAAPALQQRQKAKAAEIPFGRLFVAPALTAEPYLRTPELRVFTAFMTPPKMAVATGFSADATNGLSTTRFTGTAMAALPVYVFGAPGTKVAQRAQ
ncbi:DUF882 domain-containing protein [Aquabacter sp. CN5-332]|uniref:DUF882 domain-containing protein n=1 Tax=Aquabacter sp. CN5-332 TaxID=3156608 RepID=UPI0032B5CEAE